MAENIDTGYLVVQVNTAGMGLPVGDAHVMVSSKDKTERILTTDRNGKTETIALSAPPRANSMSPGGTENYSNYRIQTSKEGYYPVENIDVPIFGGEITVQRVTLLPLPLGYAPEEEQFVDTEPNL